MLGTGQYGTVRLAEDTRTGQLVAIKIIPNGVMERMKVEQEIQNHTMLHHENVLNVVEVVKTSDFHALVLEHADGGDLFDYIVRRGRVPEADARPVFQQLIRAVAYCHSRGIAHRDLKPENILFGSGMQVKLADFGLSTRFVDGELLTESVGSPNYAAPELLIRGMTYDGRLVDVWSCGVVLYALLAGCLPFDADAIPELFKLIKSGEYSIPGFFSREASDLVRRMLSVDPKQRISIAEIQEHPWLSDVLLPQSTNTSEVGRSSVQMHETLTRITGLGNDVSVTCLGSAMKVRAVTCTPELPDGCPRARRGHRNSGRWRISSGQVQATSLQYKGSRGVRSS